MSPISCLDVCVAVQNERYGITVCVHVLACLGSLQLNYEPTPFMLVSIECVKQCGLSAGVIEYFCFFWLGQEWEKETTLTTFFKTGTDMFVAVLVKTKSEQNYSCSWVIPKPLFFSTTHKTALWTLPKICIINKSVCSNVQEFI